jgi:hypothetical protein
MTVISNLLGGLGDSTISFGLKAIGIDKKERNKFTSGKPSVINAIPVVYGRPGWVVASPVIVGYKVDNWQQVDETVDHNRLCVHHILGEGLMRTPEAFKIEGRLVAYSKKYTQEQAKVIGGEPAPYYLNSYTSYFANGWPTGQYVNERLDSTRDQYSDARWAYSFNSLAGFISYHNTKLTADKYVNAIPRAEFLPNGIVLHDPRIPFDYDNSFVYFVPQDGSPIRSDAEIREALPKSEIGGVGRGWYAENILSETYGSNPSHMDQGYEVYGYSFNNNANSNIGDSPDNNPALVFLDYMVSDIYGASIPVSDNSLNHIIAAANYCDELAPTYAGGPTQQQLSCNIVISTEDDLRDGLEKILKTCRGLMGWVDGQYQLHIPRAGIPIAGDLGSDVIIKRRSLSLGQKSKRLNRVIATYIEPNKGYEENQLVFPPVDSAEDLQWRQTEDKGELNEAEIKLEGCTNAYQAADLCAVIIRESRASITAEYELNLTGLKYTLGDVVRITDPDGAFSNKLFYLRKWQFDFERRVVIIGVREYSDSLYDVLAHPVLERPSGTIIGVDPMIIPNVTGLAFAPAIYNKAILGKLSWTAVNHSSVIRYDVRAIGPTGSVSWASLIDASLTSIEVPYLPSGEYSLEVRARSSVAVGDYTATSVIHNVPSPIAISGLQLIGGSWVGRDAGLEWISNESEAFKRYKVEIRSAAQVVLYSEYSATPRFDLTYDKNITAGLNRAQTIAVATQYEDGSVSIFSELTITNPMPAAPTSIATAVLPNNLNISFDVVNPESDFDGASIEVHKVGDDWARIDLDENVRLYSFSDLDSNSNYEFRLVSRDAFGDGIYSSIIAINTPVPIAPAAFDVDAGVNVVTLSITAQVGYVGCVVWVRNRNSVPGTALPSWSGADSSVSVSQLTSGTDYSVYYAAVDKKGVRGAIVHIPFTTVKLLPADLSGLSPWATKLDAIDTDWISDKLEGDAIESSKIANLTAAKLTAGIINATIGIQSGGSIESSNTGYKTGLGVYEDADGTIYTLMTSNAAGDIKAGITADGVLVAKGADIEGKITIGSSSTGYGQLTDKPTSLGDVNNTEGAKLGGIADNADVTDYSGIDQDAQDKADAAAALAKLYTQSLADNFTLWSATEAIASDIMPTGSPFPKGWTCTNARGVTSDSSELIPVRRGETLQLEIWAKAEVSGPRAYMGIERYDRNKKPIASNTGCYYAGLTSTLISTTWTRYAGSVTLPTSHTPYDGSDGKECCYVRVRILLNYTSGTTDQAHYSGFKLTRMQDGDRVGLGNVDNTSDATVLNAAALVAQTKATLAKVEASAYADGIVTAEEARAISDATSKANAAQTAAINAAATDATTKANAAKDYALTTTKTIIDGGLITTGGIKLDGTAGYIKAGKSSFADTTAGIWLGKINSTEGGVNIGNATNYLKFDNTNGLDIKGKVTIASGSSGFNAFSDKPSDADMLNYDSVGGVTRIPRPQGSNTLVSASNQVGAIKITLPQGYTSTMLKFTIDVYNYLSDTSMSVEVSGYNYGGGYWVNCTAVTSGGRSLPVRFGFEGTKCCIWLGELNTSWQYPKVSLRDFTAGYNSISVDQWKSGWAITLATSFATVDRTIIDTHSDMTKTIIDGGLITTGKIELISNVGAGFYGAVHSGKSSVVDTSNGFWLAATANGAEFNIGSATDFLSYNATDGLVFSGNIATSNDRFKVNSGSDITDSAGNTVCRIESSTGMGLSVDVSGTTYGGISVRSKYRSAIAALTTDASSTSAALASSTVGSGPGVSGYSLQGTGVKADGATIGVEGSGKTGGKFTGSATRTQGNGVIELSSNACAHIKMNGNLTQESYTGTGTRGAKQYIPYGKAGDIVSLYYYPGNRVYLLHCFESTSDGKGKWQTLSGGSGRTGGALFD